MSLEFNAALNAWLEAKTALPAYWMHRPASAENACVYRCVTPGRIDGNLCDPNIKSNVYSISIYHSSPDTGATLMIEVEQALLKTGRSLNGFVIESVEFVGGFEQPLSGETGQTQYQFNRDFRISY